MIEIVLLIYNRVIGSRRIPVRIISRLMRLKILVLAGEGPG